MGILDKIKKASTIKTSAVVSESEFFKDEHLYSTGIAALDIILSARIKNGGFGAGMLVLGAPKASFKTSLSLMMVKAYLDQEPEGICVFLDSEHGVSTDYITSVGIDVERVYHVPITDIESLKQEMASQLEAIEMGDKVIFLIDSLGMLASTKETKDALDGKVAVDMTKAKELGSWARIVTPKLKAKGIPCIAINHVYQDISSMYGGKINSGGEKLQYAASSIIHISKSQVKDGKDLQGFNFTLIADKSRYVREKMRIPLTVTFDKGVQKWSGLFDLAIILGWITVPKQGWYMPINKNNGEELYPSNVRRAAIENDDEFWEKLISLGFGEDVYQNYSLAGKKTNVELVDDKAGISTEAKLGLVNKEDEGEDE